MTREHIIRKINEEKGRAVKEIFAMLCTLREMTRAIQIGGDRVSPNLFSNKKRWELLLGK